MLDVAGHSKGHVKLQFEPCLSRLSRLSRLSPCQDMAISWHLTVLSPFSPFLTVPSPGTVTGYGLAAAQLLRFRQQGVRLVVCVDELAASGGYMMACCAHKILISPFAAVGSIGVSHVNF